MSGSGTALLDFGAAPGVSDTTFAVVGQAGILSGSLVEAWVLPAATADHTADEHWAEELMVFAGNITAGVGFTIYGVHRPAYTAVESGVGTVVYGKWNIGWVWA